MYQTVSDFMLDYISDFPMWPGCLALGDWNFTTEPSDRSPPHPLLPWETRTGSMFEDIAAVCKIDAPSYLDLPAPLPHMYFSNTVSGPVSSHLDRLYVPSHWSLDDVYTLPTTWSDHHLIWGKCFIT